MAERFTTERIVDGLRFEAPSGRVDVTIRGDGRGDLAATAWNGTAAASFGASIWKLLSAVMPDLGLRVVYAAVSEDGSRGADYLNELYVSAGFQQDGRQRLGHAVSGKLYDLRLYSILDSEVRYEVTAPETNEVACEPISAV